MKRLKDKVVFITGGSRGIGRGIVKQFAAEGAKVAFVFRGSQESADSLVQDLPDLHESRSGSRLRDNRSGRRSHYIGNRE
jgi:3-oxoacyl-[acyl-carrier protein] reductase